ncbi:MAG: hypothetical protein JO270_27640 [Acidobacteriaceae bacterium]|nr:hypothetical protein [Acidobacteriaceae bacterium]
MTYLFKLADRAASTPFGTLTGHFVRGLFASENQQGESTLGLGLGMVLAVLASPGAFASIFLLEKYSTLMQFLRGHFIDPISASPSDEYFFIVLSMTITGLVMAMRWNRLIPDRRDFSNLAVLPIPIRNIFLANFTALLGLAFLFGLDVNGVSAVLFPLFVTLSIGTTGAFFRVAVSHFTSVFAASLFSFFGVFALAGLTMLLAPRRLLKPVSIALRVLLVVVLLTEFFSNLFLAFFAGRVPVRAASYVGLLPSFWFLGLYERMLGIAKPELAAMGLHGLYALACLAGVAIAAYSLCYRRHFLRLSESLDLIGAERWTRRVQVPEFLARILFRSAFERACSSFACKVLTRSEPHLMFLGAYLGIGLVLVAQAAMDASAAAQSARPEAPWLAVPLMIAFFLLSGLRFVFDMPATLDANWAFRVSIEDPYPEPRAVGRRIMRISVLPWQFAVLAPLTAQQFGWRIAVLHTGTVIALSLLLIDILLRRFRKIPFTCNAQRDIKQLLGRILGSVLSVLVAVPLLASIEGWMLTEPLRFSLLGLLLACSWWVLGKQRKEMLPFERALTFEDRPEPQFELLKL